LFEKIAKKELQVASSRLFEKIVKKELRVGCTMATIKQFEDIDSWKQARELVNQIYAMTKVSPFKEDWGLKDQIQRAAVSIMSNIAEAKNH
jgi:hypothetical protein